MDVFLNEHRALIFKHARLHVRTTGEKTPAEDIAKELELLVTQLHAATGIEADEIQCAESFVRQIVVHAARRAKRRRTLIEQIAAGDDLQAVSDDLRALDSDLPALPAPPGEAAQRARATLDVLTQGLTPRDALIFALLVEDELSPEEAAEAIGIPVSDVALARERILHQAEKAGIEPDAERREGRS